MVLDLMLPCPSFWHPPLSEMDRLELFCICRNPWPGLGFPMRPAWCRCIPVDSPVAFSRVQCDFFRQRSPPVHGGKNLQWCPCTYPPGHPHGHWRWSVSLESFPGQSSSASSSSQWVPLNELRVAFTHPAPGRDPPRTPPVLAEGPSAPLPPVDDLFSQDSGPSGGTFTLNDLCPVIDVFSSDDEVDDGFAPVSSVHGDVEGGGGGGDEVGDDGDESMSGPEPLLSAPPDNTGFLDPTPELCAWFISNAVEATMPSLVHCQQCPCTWASGQRHLRWTLASDPVRLARFVSVVAPVAMVSSSSGPVLPLASEVFEVDLSGEVPLTIYPNRVRPVFRPS